MRRDEGDRIFGFVRRGTGIHINRSLIVEEPVKRNSGKPLRDTADEGTRHQYQPHGELWSPVIKAYMDDWWRRLWQTDL